MEPCDVHFLAWWRVMLMRHAGIAEAPDLISAHIWLKLSIALQQRLGNLPKPDS